MEIALEFDKFDIRPIGEDVRHLDKANSNIINMIHAHSTWIKSCDEKMMDPTTSDYDIQHLTLEKSAYQSRINAMLFAEQDHE